MSFVVKCGDCLDWMKQQEDNSVDMVFTSPPYGKKRTYGELNFSLSGQDWVDWCVERYLQCNRICRGLVAWVVEGGTSNFQWDATPVLLMSELHRRGVKLRKPPVFHRVGIPGSGGPDFWRNDWEFIICSSKGKLPWSDNTASGNPCKYPPGGAMSHRLRDGSRKGSMEMSAIEPKAIALLNGELPPGSKLHTKSNGKEKRVQCYVPPEKANPGNVIKCSVGGGRMGSPLAHENEAPFPEQLVEPFVECFCKPGGVVFDPFCGSGTTGAVSKRLGRSFLGVDIRQSQVDLAKRRIESVAVGDKILGE